MGMGKRIFDAREKAGLTQKELGKTSGVTSQAVSQWESGSTKSLVGDNLIKISTALGVNAKWLLSGRGPMCHNNDLTSVSEEQANYKNNELEPWQMKLLDIAGQLTKEQREVMLSVGVALAKNDFQKIKERKP